MAMEAKADQLVHEVRFMCDNDLESIVKGAGEIIGKSEVFRHEAVRKISSISKNNIYTFPFFFPHLYLFCYAGGCCFEEMELLWRK